jgi:hypothetical protein
MTLTLWREVTSVHYSGAAVALAAAMTFSLTATAIGQTRRATAVFQEPAGEIVEAGAPPCTATFCKTLSKRYKNKSLLGITEFLTNYPTCTFISPGDWRPGLYPTSTTFDIQPKDKDNGTRAGMVDISEPTFTGPTPPGCDGSGGPYLYAPIYFKWTLERNLTAVPNFGPTATFNSTWYSPTGCMPPSCDFVSPYSFQITVPVVRPDHETTEFVAWDTANPTVGEWKQKLHPPSDDPSFDFSGELVQEFAAAPVGPDTCWFVGSMYPKFEKITGGTWSVGQLVTELATTQPGKKVWGADFVGRGFPRVAYYRLNSPTFKIAGSCGTQLGQTMKINAPSDPAGSYTAYGSANTGNVNVLGASLTATTVTSIRSGSSMTETWP